jgi:hypothetical protein
MKNKTKTITLICLLLGSLFYLLSNKKQTIAQHQLTSAKDTSILTIDNKPLLLPAPKVYISTPAKNGLGIGNNWKSK